MSEFPFFFELALLLVTWDGLDSVIWRRGTRVEKEAPEEKVRALMDAREELAIAGEFPAYTNQEGFWPLGPVSFPYSLPYLFLLFLPLFLLVCGRGTEY